MNARLKGLWIGIGAVVVAVLLYFWWTNTHEKRWFDRTVPVEGEASYNDYYVLEQALRAQGVKVESMPHLQQDLGLWSEKDSLLLGSDLKTLSPEQVDALLDWVGRGGQLLVAAHADDSRESAPLLDRIGIVPASGNWCLQLHDGGKPTGPDCFRTFGFQPAERESFQSATGSDANGWIAARRSWGLGQIEVLSDFDRLQNGASMNLSHSLLADNPHLVAGLREGGASELDWTWQVVAPMLQGGVFHIVYQSELPPLYVYLVKYGWYALLPLLFALLAWLWARSQRFGPVMPLPSPDRRALGEHIQASGEYLYRRGLIPALYAPLRRRFDDQLRRRDPELASLSPAEIASALAQRQRLSLEAVQQALRPPQPGQRKVFLSTVQTLLHLIRHL